MALQASEDRAGCLGCPHRAWEGLVTEGEKSTGHNKWRPTLTSGKQQDTMGFICKPSNQARLPAWCYSETSPLTRDLQEQPLLKPHKQPHEIAPMPHVPDSHRHLMSYPNCKSSTFPGKETHVYSRWLPRISRYLKTVTFISFCLCYLFSEWRW